MSENVRKWTARQKKYAHWKANPYREETKEEFAKTINITDKTLRRWDKLEGFKDLVDGLIEEYTDGEEAEIWRAVIENAKGGKDGSADRRLFFQLKGKLVERQEHGFDDNVESVEVKIVKAKDEPKPEGN